MDARSRTHLFPIPPLIRRNTVLLATTQAFVGVGTQLMPTLGGIIIERLLGSIVLAGLGTGLLYFSRLLVAYPVGWVIDSYGRRAGLQLGLVLSLVGTVVIGSAVTAMSFPLFVAGALVFGLGVGAGQQLRTAAADMYLPERRAQGLGYVLTGSLIGALGGPLLIGAALAGADRLRVDPAALAWFLVPVVLVPSMALVLLIRPDPKAIAADLPRFYPGYEPPPVVAETILAMGAGVRAWIAHYPLRVAFLAMFAAHGLMTMMMALTPLAMARHGQALTMISLAVSLHVVGMFGLSLPIGWLADRIGRRAVIVAGLAVDAAGAVLAASTPDYTLATAGIVLVGLGWSCVNVAVTALVADTVPAAERGRAVGVVDSFAGAASIALPLLGGPVAELFGFPALAILGVALVVAPIAMTLRLGEVAPGRYADAAA